MTDYGNTIKLAIASKAREACVFFRVENEVTTGTSRQEMLKSAIIDGIRNDYNMDLSESINLKGYIPEDE